MALGYTYVGCFADKRQRTISGRLQNFCKDTIKNCYKYAKTLGYQYFAIQYDIQCFTSKTAGETYRKYGPSLKCRNGTGAWLANSVYEIKIHPCDKENNGGCNQVCNKREEWHVCSCKAGFVLGKDKRTCKKGERNV